jgi:hypothetical protein
MKQILKLTKRNIRQQLMAYLIIGVLVGILLSACGTNPNVSAKQSNTPTPVPTPAINMTIVNQDNMQLQTFQQWIELMQQYKGDVTVYQKQYEEDQRALRDAHTDKAYKDISTTLSSQINAIKLPALKAEANTLYQTLEDKVSAWGSQHIYHDDYNGLNYQYGYEYTDRGIVGGDAYAINTAQTLNDYQRIIEDLNTYLVNFQAMTEEASDTTPYNQQHKADIELMQKYGNMQGKVVLISLYGQAIRVYNNGQLVNAFFVTTGTPAHPSLPGTWWVQQKESPTTFKSVVPKGDPDYYPDTPINYAMLYHSGGYNMHDSWWRADYGPGTEFPHIDATGNQSAAQGSHGCVNMSLDNARWLYGYTELYTPVIIY